MRMNASPPRGFTLIELLVAISIMAVMAVLSWRGLDGMTKAQTLLQQRADEVLTVQSGLAQWGADLDAMIQLPQTQALEWDGRALRLTRQSPGDEGVVVVAWSRRDIDGTGQWLRWQSPPLRTRGDFQTAWSAAAQWAQNPGDDLKKREVRLGPLSQWQIFYFRNDAWTNPLSSSDAPLTGSAANIATALAIAIPSTVASAVPEGVRLVLTLPPGQAISGVLTRDWLRPTLGGGKS